MAVRIAEIESEFALATLAQKLTEAGWNVQGPAEAHVPFLRVEWPSATGESLADAVVGFIFCEWQYLYLDHRLHTLYPSLEEDEREYLALFAFHLLRHGDGDGVIPAPDEWRDTVADAVAQVLDTGARLHLDGIIRFRARHWLALMDEVIHEVVDQFYADRDYEEFVAMLRYHLEAQPPSQQELHVYCTDQLVWVCDAAGQLVRDHQVMEVAYAQDGRNVNAEDVAMSLLITRSPCRIVLHNATKAAPWPSFAETVERVFLERVVHCPGCLTCQQLELGPDLPGQQNVFPFPKE